jgi:signal transduction histidine kinase
MQADFVSTVSHEFRSPLTGVRQLAELLDSGLVSSEDRKKEYYRLILQESGRLTRLVENLLDFSRLEAGRKQYNMTRLDTTAWLDEVAGAVRDPRLVVDLDPCLPPILGDRDALSSAVANLIDNALKYSPRESPVSLTAAASGGDIRVSVADAGPGIPASERARIFDKFYRGQGDPAERVKGAGIGLSLVRRIVEDHGGTVTLESREGEGSVFTLQLKTESAP